MVKIKLNGKTLHVSKDLDIDSLVVHEQHNSSWVPQTATAEDPRKYGLMIPLKDGENYRYACYNGVDKSRERVREAFLLGLKKSNKKKELAKRIDILECHVNALLEASQL